ncbi:PH domain-containing protein [Dietzia sp.]|uniref:PH domain-containing protein n=1 Tax=Dietzia sp. TaxID=1871616 RepID=UPI002FDB73A7
MSSGDGNSGAGQRARQSARQSSGQDAKREIPDSDTQGWDFDYRPRKLRIFAWIAAVAVIIIHVLWALSLTSGRDSGVTISGADQWAFVFIGLIIAGVVLLTLRIRVRAGRAGVELTGFLQRTLFRWDDVVGFTFPVSAQWARLELPAYEHAGIKAIQAMDRDPAVAAMRSLREVARKYKPSAADAESVADR